MRPSPLPPLLLSGLLASLALPLLARAGDWQSPDSIRAAAIQALGADPARAEATLAAHVRLAACAQPLQAVASGPRTALVRCPDEPGWKLYVPVEAHREADVVVLRTPARAGQPLAAEQLVVQRREVPVGKPLPPADPAALVGRIPARALADGSVVGEDDLALGPPLRRGDPVVLVSRVGGIEVRMAGRALGGAAPGRVVRAENVESRRVVRGRLTAPGVVEVLQ
ncbi:MAG TPA: flagellar basal body P-ring formation chaperone FlgA [Xanthomonadaceae bacterium]|nr:flagellar basal body P-ring formation chaperone FlgA [Xanthomonadaceae bacterium]